MKKNITRGLYAITDTALLGGQLLPAVRAALEGGAVVLQYRDKSLISPAHPARREQEARALQHLCREFSCVFLINDDIALAQKIQADGVHLGRSDSAIAHARAALGAHAIIGATCHDSLAFAAAAHAQGADYLAFGAFYPSPTKPQATLATQATLAAARASIDLPLVAIGGITRHNAAPLIAAGAHNVAVISDLWRAPSVREHAQAYTDLFRASV